MRWYLIVIAFLFSCSVFSQDSVTTRDYQRAVSFLGFNTDPLIQNYFLRANWINGESFWYHESGNTSVFYLVNASKKTKTRIFDPKKLADLLSDSESRVYRADSLPFSTIRFSADMKNVYLKTSSQAWKYNLAQNKLQKDSEDIGEVKPKRNESLSPDKKKVAFIRDHNLWVRELTGGKEYAVTTDGMKDYGYATDNAGWRHSDAPVLLWSPDSKKIATFQQDERRVGDMYLVTTNVGHPKLEAWKYPLPGDSSVIMIERVIIDLESRTVVRLNIPPDYHRATLGDDISSFGKLEDAQWSEDGATLAFVSSSRDHKNTKFRIANAKTGQVKEVFEETVATQFESGQTAISWRYLPQSKEVIWYSERDNWGHLYLYDSETGKLKNQITKGDFVVAEILKVDETTRKVFFMAVGLDSKNPYFQHFCSIGFNGENFTDLTPEEGNHRISLSPSGAYFFDDYSQPDTPSVFITKSIVGANSFEVARTNISLLVNENQWKPCTPFSVKAADGKTDIYGLMYTPTKMDSTKKYPLIDYIYPGPQGGSVGSWSFIAAKGDNQALAELGFIVIAIEGTSNPMRSKSFHDMSYGNMAENTLPDQVSGIRQLAVRYSFIDTSRIGIWGHSGGGFATADAMFTYPDFFKVGIAESGNHDNRNYEDDWGERYIGLLKKNLDGTDNYTEQANQMHAKNLKGKLMLVHGMMDDNVPPYNTLLVVKALQDANKDFDLVIFPDSRHGYGKYSYYMMRKRWDYFVEHLLGAAHPHEFKIEGF